MLEKLKLIYILRLSNVSFNRYQSERHPIYNLNVDKIIKNTTINFFKIFTHDI